jgi:Fe-S cluster assembly protein SufD
MATAMQQGFTQESFDAFLATRDEPDWMRELRLEAWRSFQDLPLPSRKDEEWMRTDIRLLKLDQFGPPTSDMDPTVELPPALLADGVQLGGSAVSYNGRPVNCRISEKWARQGVLFGAVDEVAREHSDLVRRFFAQMAFDAHVDKFSALHGAFWAGGAMLFVPRGVVVDEPFHSYAVTSDGGVDTGRLLIVLEDGAEATFLNETSGVSPITAALHCGATELIVGPGANLRFVNLQNWGDRTWHFAHQKGVVQRDGALQWTIGALGSRLAKVNQHVALTGPHADCQVNGTMFAEGRQHLSYHTLQHHLAPSTHSDFLYKTALQDRSRTVWRGMIKVDPDGQRTDGYQRNDNLLLSSDARADSIPGLEIEADDVRCTHGATTGKVDEEQIFYAQCRGFTRKEATRAIVIGFFQQVFDRIPIESVREALGLAIAQRVREYE